MRTSEITRDDYVNSIDFGMRVHANKMEIVKEMGNRGFLREAIESSAQHDSMDPQDARVFIDGRHGDVPHDESDYYRWVMDRWDKNSNIQSDALHAYLEVYPEIFEYRARFMAKSDYDQSKVRGIDLIFSKESCDNFIQDTEPSRGNPVMSDQITTSDSASRDRLTSP